MALSPRRIDKYHGQRVKSYFAEEKSDPAEQAAEFARIIDREESLLMAMEAVTVSTAASNSEERRNDVSPFGAIEITEAPEKHVNQIKENLPANIRSLVKKVYAVHDIKQAEKFEAYKESRANKKTKLFWHGSRNENWISIIRNSLMLNPSAHITGKMFGNGIYFAPDAGKSWNYTSYNGTYWAHGDANTAYMALYEVVYGDPYYPEGVVRGSKEMLDEKGKDCLHAKADKCGLRNDEVVFFDEAAINIRFLVEFGNEAEEEVKENAG